MRNPFRTIDLSGVLTYESYSVICVNFCHIRAKREEMRANANTTQQVPRMGLADDSQVNLIGSELQDPAAQNFAASAGSYAAKSMMSLQQPQGYSTGGYTSEPPLPTYSAALTYASENNPYK